jgi:proline iminopeptidase
MKPATWVREHGGMTAAQPRTLLDLLWSSRWSRFGAALGSAAGSGLFVGVLLPRGPLTAGHALGVMLAGLLAGVAAGFALRSRWALALAPVAHVLLLEGLWQRSELHSVGSFEYSETFGLLAFGLLRLFYLFVGLFPMLLGAAIGAGLARRLRYGPEHPQGRMARVSFYSRRAFTGVSALLLVALAALILRPASTPAIVGPDDERLPGSIAELTTVRLGGQEQAIMLRGESVDNPVLLYLSGGPGQSDLPFTRAIMADLSRDFIVVGWDQRGTGKSYAALEPSSTLTPERMVANTVELTNYLRERFGEEKIYLLGGSWGSILGILAVQQHPELYHAFISGGQMVSPLETTQRLHAEMLAYAERTNDPGLAEKMHAYGNPPYDDIYAYAFVMGYYDKLAGDYDPPAAYIERGESAGLGPWGVLGSEYALVEKVNVMRGLIDVFAILWPQLHTIDFRRDATTLDVPVYLFVGDHELHARSDLAREWFAALQAPDKQLYTVEDAGHDVVFEGFQDIHRVLTEVIVPTTYAAH